MVMAPWLQIDLYKSPVEELQPKEHTVWADASDLQTVPGNLAVAYSMLYMSDLLSY
jgi:hypothetical protein